MADSVIQKKLSIGLPPQIQSARNSILEITLLVVICSLFTWFVVLPKLAEYNTKKDLLSTIKESQNKMADDLQIMRTLASDLKVHQKDVQILDDALPLDGKALYLEFLVRQLAESSGVILGDLNVNSKSNAVIAGDTTLLANPYKVTRSLQKLSGNAFVTGTLAQLVNFLKKMENSGRLLQVSALEISSAQAGSLGMRLTFDSYYLAP